VADGAGWDDDLVVALARGKDPGLPEETARELVVLAREHLLALGEPDAPEIARRLLADHHRAGASAAAVVARAAVEHTVERRLVP
jgi:hypothetical protein